MRSTRDVLIWHLTMRSIYLRMTFASAFSSWSQSYHQGHKGYKASGSAGDIREEGGTKLPELWCPCAKSI